MSKQKTLKSDVSLSGVGLHTGKEVQLIFKPAPENHGFVFKRTDLEGEVLIEADANLVTETQRGTTITKGEHSIHTVEHVLAALVGLDIDNALIEINAPEPPILDGSSIQFMDAILQVGVSEQELEKNYFEITSNIHYKNEEEGIEIIAVPADEYQVSVMVDYGSKVLGSQNATMNSIQEFHEEFASSRTFCFLHELQQLLDHGLIRGGELGNAIVYVDQVVTDEELQRLRGVFNKETVTVRPNGILDNLELRHPNEAARHKLLDVVGDLALVGQPIKGKIIATKPGHKANTDFAKMIKEVIKMEKKKTAPTYDPNAEPLMDIHQIMDTLPHRPPFLLVDKIIELTEERVVGVKNVTMNEPFFVGHFPGAPVMPGVLQVEAMAQAGGILALNTVPDPENYLTYFMKIDKVKFKQKVLPGDTLIFDLKLMAPIRRGICQMEGKAYVGDKVVMEGELMAQITKAKND